MEKSEYIKKYTKEIQVESPFCGESNEKGFYNIIVSKERECYLTLKGFLNDKDDFIGFLAEHEITQIDSTFCSKEYPVANIGFSEKENKWYGWSHRAIFGFTIGSKCKEGDCAYIPMNKEDYIKNAISFWSDDSHKNVRAEDITEEGFDIVWTYSDDILNESLRGTDGGMHESFPKKYGRGEWTAKTIEDAKQMAIDFANNIS